MTCQFTLLTFTADAHRERGRVRGTQAVYSGPIRKGFCANPLDTRVHGMFTNALRSCGRRSYGSTNLGLNNR